MCNDRHSGKRYEEGLKSMTSSSSAFRFVGRGFLLVKMPPLGLRKSVHYHRSQGENKLDKIT